MDHTCKRDVKQLFSLYYWAWCWNYQDDVLSLGHAEKSKANDYHNSPDLKKLCEFPYVATKLHPDWFCQTVLHFQFRMWTFYGILQLIF